MKRKIKHVKDMTIPLEQRLAGVGTFRITGPCARTGERVTVIFKGTREGAERYPLVAQSDAG